METINHECYVSLEVAKLLKEAGFDWEIDTLYFPYNKNKNEVNQESVPRNWNSKNADEDGYMTISTPTLEVAQKWLREVKECAVIVETHNVQAACVSAYVYCIYPIDAAHPCEHINGFAEDQCFDTYEDALEAGIKKALELILEKGE